MIEIADVLGVHLQKGREIGHDVADAPLLLPAADALLQPRQEEVVVQFEQRFDVGEHLRDQLLSEHVVHPILLVDPELEYLSYAHLFIINYQSKSTQSLLNNSKTIH